MGNVIGLTFIVVFVLQTVGTVAYLVQTSRLLRRLESNHPEIHKSLGDPQLVANNTPRNNMLLLRWLWRRDYQSIGDAATVSLASIVRMLFVLLVSGFVFMIFLFVLLQLQHARAQ
jgi:hypothetical protein